MTAVYLPSTSPANRAYRKKPAFIETWMRVREALNDGGGEKTSKPSGLLFDGS
jgi:hypothetical protein